MYQKISEKELEKYANQSADDKIRYENEMNVKSNKPKETNRGVNSIAAGFRIKFGQSQTKNNWTKEDIETVSKCNSISNELQKYAIENNVPMNSVMKGVLKEFGHYAKTCLLERPVPNKHNSKTILLKHKQNKNKRKSIGNFYAQSEIDKEEKLFREMHKKYYFTKDHVEIVKT